MGGAISRIGGMLKPSGAVNLQKLAETQALKNALQNYINAYRALPMNQRERQNIQKLLNTVGDKNNIKYKNRIATAIAGIVKASKVANVVATTVVANGAPEGGAAAAVNNAASKIKNLNNFMAGFKGGNANALTQYYTNSGRNSKTNRNLNSGRNGGARYASLWNNLNRRSNVTVFAGLPGEMAVSNEANRQAVINKALSEINTAGNNINKLRGIKTRLNNAKFNRGQAPANAASKYDIMVNKIAANKALKNANALTENSNQATINSVLNQLRKVQNRVPNTMRTRISNKIAIVERQSLLKTPKPLNQ
jgi:hypothetical protein